MLRDCEVQDVCKIMLRLAKIGNKLDDFYDHTENLEREHLVIAQAFLRGAIAFLALVGGQDDMEK
jgi:hypothetical protein